MAGQLNSQHHPSNEVLGGAELAPGINTGGSPSRIEGLVEQR